MAETRSRLTLRYRLRLGAGGTGGGTGLEVDVVDVGDPSSDAAPGATRTPGVAILLLHGIGMSSASLEPVAAALAPSHRAVCLTLPGHGRTRAPGKRLSVEDVAALAAEACDHLGLRRVVAVGQSMGVQFCVELARSRPDLVAGLVLVGPVVDDAHPSPFAQAWALAVDSTRERPAANALVLRDYLRAGPRWYARMLRSMLAYPTRAVAAGLDVPTIVVRGAGDPIAGAHWAERLAGSMRTASVATLRGAHHAQLVVPDDVAGLVRTLARADARRDAPRQGPAVRARTDQHGH